MAQVVGPECKPQYSPPPKKKKKQTKKHLSLEFMEQGILMSCDSEKMQLYVIFKLELL
jgi:hypothetical protein